MMPRRGVSALSDMTACSKSHSSSTRMSFPNANTEAGYLAAFDAGRDAIQKVAIKAYGYTRRRLYVLTANDFR